MITVSFLWLILSHLMGFYIIYHSFLYRLIKWVPIASITLSLMLISSIYHWTDQVGYENKYNFTLLGLKYVFWLDLDHYISGLVIFLITFNVLSPESFPRYDRICFILIIIITFAMYHSKLKWYFYCLVLACFQIIYMIICRDLNWYLLIDNFLSHKLLGLYSFMILVIGICSQYYFCAKYSNQLVIWHWFHGIWHFCMLYSGGLFIKLNNYMIMERIKNKYILTTDLPTNEIEIENIENDQNINNLPDKLKQLKKFYINKYSISANDLMELGYCDNDLKKNKYKSESDLFNMDPNNNF